MTARRVWSVLAKSDSVEVPAETGHRVSDRSNRDCSRPGRTSRSAELRIRKVPGGDCAAGCGRGVRRGRERGRVEAKRRGLTLAELSELTGVSLQSLSKNETGRRHPAVPRWRAFRPVRGDGADWQAALGCVPGEPAVGLFLHAPPACVPASGPKSCGAPGPWPRHPLPGAPVGRASSIGSGVAAGPAESGGRRGAGA
ncbi:helix-turn-helix domain-containing protein [Streptomyces sp. NPDC002659]|uniref:helix-turn-helix domain-containing protein n=1 Tax=Streptomyces sp. NPDC002659 TaxID=3364656 RepID=UPI003691CB3E